jgi:myotubularin-related protein 14
VSVGSWQLISGTGSLRSQDSNIVVINEQQQAPSTNQFNNNNINLFSSCNAPSHPFNNMCSNHQSANQQSGPSTLIDDDCFTANDYFMRRERLTAVRTLFYNCYSSTIGYKFKNGDSATLGSLLGNFAEKVGLTQRTPV